MHIIYKIREKAKRLREVLLKDVNIIEQCNVVHQLGFIFSGKIALKTTFLKVFPCYEKRLHSPFLPLHRQNKEVWVSGLNQHTANVPDRKVPKVRNRLQRAQKPSLLGLCRASGDSQRNPSASALWLVSSVGSEHDATNVGVGSSSLSRVTILEVWQSWSIAPVLKTGRRQRLKGSKSP